MKSHLSVSLALCIASSPCFADDSAKIKCSELGRKFAADFKKEYVNAIRD